MFPLADFNNHLLRRVILSSGLMTLAGSLWHCGPDNYGYTDGQGTAASFYYPQWHHSGQCGGPFAVVVW